MKHKRFQIIFFDLLNEWKITLIISISLLFGLSLFLLLFFLMFRAKSNELGLNFLDITPILDIESQSTLQDFVSFLTNSILDTVRNLVVVSIIGFSTIVLLSLIFSFINSLILAHISTQSNWIKYYLILKKMNNKKVLFFFLRIIPCIFIPLIIFIPKGLISFEFYKILIYSLVIPALILTVSWSHRLNLKTGLNKFVYLNSDNKLEFYKIIGISLISNLMQLTVIYLFFSIIIPFTVNNEYKAFENLKISISTELVKIENSKPNFPKIAINQLKEKISEMNSKLDLKSTVYQLNFDLRNFKIILGCIILVFLIIDIYHKLLEVETSNLIFWSCITLCIFLFMDSIIDISLPKLFGIDKKNSFIFIIVGAISIIVSDFVSKVFSYIQKGKVICPKCKRILDDSVRHCYSCGTKIFKQKEHIANSYLVLNVNSHTLHSINCSAVNNYDHNNQVIFVNKDQMKIVKGFKYCKNCKEIYPNI